MQLALGVADVIRETAGTQYSDAAQCYEAAIVCVAGVGDRHDDQQLRLRREAQRVLVAAVVLAGAGVCARHDFAGADRGRRYVVWVGCAQVSDQIADRSLHLTTDNS